VFVENKAEVVNLEGETRKHHNTRHEIDNDHVNTMKNNEELINQHEELTLNIELNRTTPVEVNDDPVHIGINVENKETNVYDESREENDGASSYASIFFGCSIFFHIPNYMKNWLQE